MILNDALIKASQSLAEKGFDLPQLEARILICHALGLSMEKLLIEKKRILTPEEEKQISTLIERRLTGEPIAYITGEKEFMGLSFKVTKDTLIPRPDSEIMIEKIIHLFKDRNEPIHILDLGTGSGCLILSLLAHLPQSTGIAVDLSEKAISAARANADNLGLDKRCEFIRSNWTDAIDKTQKFDIVVSNPPYIDPDDQGIDKHVEAFEPHNALFAEDKGLSDYKKLAQQIYQLNAKHIFLEIGYDQSELVKAIFVEQGFSFQEQLNDLEKRPRCLILHNPNY